MEKVLKIDPSACARFNGVLHAQFHNQMNALITGEDTEKLHLSESLLTEWRGYIDTEISINRETTALLETKRMKEKDAERDSVLSYIMGKVKNETLSTDTAIREAAEHVRYVVTPYAGIQKESNDAETLLIHGLLEDLGKAEYKADVEKLGLTAAISQLRTLNTEYQELRMGRTDSRVERKLPLSKEIRPLTDAAYNNVCAYIEASYLLGAAENKPVIESVVARMNQLIREMKATHNQSMAQKNRTTKEKEDSPAEETQETESKENETNN